MNLPFPDRLRVDEAKIVGCLLSHANGRGKAAFFLGFGFRPEAWVEFAEALKEQARAYPVLFRLILPMAPAIVLTEKCGRRQAEDPWYARSGFSKEVQIIRA